MDYFARFGPPRFSNHAYRRLVERGIDPVALEAALRTEPRPGRKPGTLQFRAGEVVIVVNAADGQLITVWRTTMGDS